MKLFQVVTKYHVPVYVLVGDIVTAHDKFILFVDEYITQKHANIDNSNEPKELLRVINQISKIDMKCNPHYFPNVHYIYTNLWEVKLQDYSELRTGLSIKDVISNEVADITIFTESCIIIK